MTGWTASTGGSSVSHAASLVISGLLIVFNVVVLSRGAGKRRGYGPLYLFVIAGAPLVLANPTARLLHELGATSDQDLGPELESALFVVTWGGNLAMLFSTLWNMSVDRCLRQRCARCSTLISVASNLNRPMLDCDTEVNRRFQGKQADVEDNAELDRLLQTRAHS